MSPNVTYTISYVSIAPRVTETGSFPARPAGAGSGGLRLAYDLNASSESGWWAAAGLKASELGV